MIAGLTRKIPYDVLDRGFGAGLSFFPRTESLGIVLPSNSPGVHSLWTPAFALKIPLVLKPGSAEPWTPYRLIQALIRAGAPAEVFSYYPADHAGGAEILRQCGRGMVFGDVGSTRMWANDPRIEVHGPGFSKIVIGEDCIEEWEQYLDVMVASIAGILAGPASMPRAYGRRARRKNRRSVSGAIIQNRPPRGRRSGSGVVPVCRWRRSHANFENDRRRFVYARSSRYIGFLSR